MSVTPQKNAVETIESAFFRLRDRVSTLRTEQIAARKNRLKKIRSWIHDNRTSIHEAIYIDLKKPVTETDGTELFHVLSEVNLAINNLTTWTNQKKVDAPITMIGTRSFLQYEPKGLCLIIAPWNYPFSLCVGPLISSLAAGNAVIVKPSELTPHVSAIIKRMVTEVLDDEVVVTIEGDAGVSQQLLALPFDHIFFTGSPAVGKIVMKAAAEHLASVTLELGGKSPTIVTASANLDDAAQRIVVSKFINNGQTCVAPDYVLVDESIAVPFLQKTIAQLNALFRDDDQSFKDSKHYARIVNEKHFDRLSNLLQGALAEGASLAFSGGTGDRSELFFPPTILSRADGKLPIDDDEIFGPILPIIRYRTIEEAITLINNKPKPLAMYIFSTAPSDRNKVLRETSSGGVCVNDCAIHFLHHNLPFGGVGNSGTGRSHGYAGFLAFSNEKSVMKQRSGFTSVKAFYPPYTSFKQKLMNLFLKFF